MDSMSIIKVIEHYQRSIEKCGGDDDRMIHCINKLYTLPVTVSHLQETGIGRTVNSLRKFEGRVGHAARTLVAKWKAMVAAEESSGSEQEENSEEVDCEVTNSTENEENNKNYIEESHSVNHYETSKSHKYDKSRQEAKIKETSKQKHRHSENHKRKNEEEVSNNHKKRKEEKSHRDKRENSYKCDLKIKSDLKSDSSKSKKSLEQVSKYDKNHDSSEYSYKRIDDKSDKESRHKSNSGNIEDRDSSTIKNSKKHRHKNSKDGNLDDNKKNYNKSKYENNDQSKSHCSLKENEIHRKSSSSSDKKNDEQKYKKNKKSSSSCDEDEENKKVSTSKQNSSNYSKKETDTSFSNKLSKHNKKKVEKAVENSDDEEGINSFSGASFAEALGMMEKNDHLSSPVRKKVTNNSTNSLPSSKSSSKTTKVSIVSDNKSSKSSDLLSPNVKLPAMPSELDIDVNLPVISPNYKPLSSTVSQLSSIYRGVSQEEMLSAVMSHKNLRTKVYSGNKIGWAAVPSLFDLCIRILQENIDALEYTGGVPFSILQPVLERATPDQLSTLEYYNPNLLEDTDILWEQHCKREFRGKVRQELETWREAYTRFSFEREEKLKALTANIKQSTIEKLTPLRQTKLAYLDSVAKPPRAIARKQAKWGTASNAKPMTTPASRIAALTSGSSASGSNNITVPNPVKPVSTSSSKPRKAPLMAKTLSLLKNTSRYRR